MKKYFLMLFIFLRLYPCFSQGYNHQWLLGSYNFFQDPKGRMLFNQSGYSLINENRKMVFKGTEGNISDANGNLLMSSNGIWIANALNDTMQNGSGLNPSILASNWPFGFPLNFGNVFLPFPNDSNKYVLIHKTAFDVFADSPKAIYKSLIDIALDSVIEKNDTLLIDTLSWGIGSCKHANGRDWWIFVMRDYNPIAYTFLLTPNGIDTIFTQTIGFTANTIGNVSGIVFSQDGTKMIYSTPISQSPNGTLLISDFDRCSGLFSNTQAIPITSNEYLFGLAFSPSGNYAYTCSSNYIFQINVSSLQVDTVAMYDGFISPPTSWCCATTFFGMYLAANGKIYVTSGSGVQHLHEINYPDSAGITCDVQQHSINLGYAQLRAVPNHPNYYLGCDTTLGCLCLIPNAIEESVTHNFNVKIFPNPSDGNFSISYLLPQNHKGKLEIFDIEGRKVYNQNLSQWSTLQFLNLQILSNGVYVVKLSSDNYSETKKLSIQKE